MTVGSDRNAAARLSGNRKAFSRHTLEQGTHFRNRSYVYAGRNQGKATSMISRRTFVLTFAAGTLLAGALPSLAKPRHSSIIGMFDTDNDGTIDLAEAKKAASAAF